MDDLRRLINRRVLAEFHRASMTMLVGLAVVTILAGLAILAGCFRTR